MNGNLKYTWLGTLVSSIAFWIKIYSDRIAHDEYVKGLEYSFIYDTGPTTIEFGIGTITILILLYGLYTFIYTTKYNKKTPFQKDLGTHESRAALIFLSAIVILLLAFVFWHINK